MLCYDRRTFAAKMKDLCIKIPLYKLYYDNHYRYKYCHLWVPIWLKREKNVCKLEWNLYQEANIYDIFIL